MQSLFLNRAEGTTVFRLSILTAIGKLASGHGFGIHTAVVLIFLRARFPFCSEMTGTVNVLFFCMNSNLISVLSTNSIIRLDFFFFIVILILVLNKININALIG